MDLDLTTLTDEQLQAQIDTRRERVRLAEEELRAYRTEAARRQKAPWEREGITRKEFMARRLLEKAGFDVKRKGA